MDVQQLVEQLRREIEQARAMPMSSSAVVNRAELLGIVGQLEAALPQALAASDQVYSDRESVLDDARKEAERIVVEAQIQRDQLVSETDVHQLAKRDADRLRAEADREASALRKETDEYVDQRLASFEITLNKTLEAVARGRERLHGRSGLDQPANDDEPFRFPGHDDD
ncbi:MAG: hypothetical protein H0U36_01810 [Nocardioidaceae bacterium]|nr:hypothetical protein [Nocardioidaceae bacterium]